MGWDMFGMNTADDLLIRPDRLHLHIVYQHALPAYRTGSAENSLVTVVPFKRAGTRNELAPQSSINLIPRQSHRLVIHRDNSRPK